MPFKIVGYLTRKPGMTPAEFRNYYENTHMPLLVSLTGAAFPKTHTRTYLTRTPIDSSSSDTTNANYVAAAFAGKPENLRMMRMRNWCLRMLRNLRSLEND
jgi:hypothetical protein